MIIEAFILQLRTLAPVFGGRVGGAAEFYAGLKNYNTSLPMPAAYVLPLGQEADANDVWGGLVQIVHKGVGVAVELDAQADRRGQTPVMNFEEIEAQIFRSCLNLIVDPCRMARGASFSGARYLDLDRARLWYQWEFNLNWQINAVDDGVPTECDTAPPLREIDMSIFLVPPPMDTSKPPAVEVHIEVEVDC